MQTKEQLEELRKTKQAELAKVVSEHDQWLAQAQHQAIQNQLRVTRLEGSIHQLTELIEAAEQERLTPI